jgi:hypothetical protein
VVVVGNKKIAGVLRMAIHDLGRFRTRLVSPRDRRWPDEGEWP